MKPSDLDTFTQAYLAAALWSSTDDDCEPLDKLYSMVDIHEDTLRNMAADCAKFQEEHGVPDYTMAKYVSGEYTNEERAGHDFWLTRNGHGTGVWDRGFPEDISNRWRAAMKAYGTYELYVGDDGLIHGSL